MFKKALLIFLIISASHYASGQFLMDMVDTTKEMGQGMLSIYRKFDHIRIGGYIQTQYQVASEKGAKSFNGGDFPENVNNRFMLRRGRLRFDYVHYREAGGPSFQFVFQFDGTERGVFIRDFWGRMFENKWKVFAFTTGMFARPISYELNLSSSDRESPERGRMSQLLMKTERDLGAMVSFEPRVKTHRLSFLRIDAGFFNGQGLTAPGDFDSHKDLITRLTIKPIQLKEKLSGSAGISWFNGGFIQNTNYSYAIYETDAESYMKVDSTPGNKGRILPRKYYGADIQLKLKRKAGATEIRGEYLYGKQTATLNSSETPPVLLIGNQGYYTRNFNGGYFYLLHNIFNPHHQLVLKYDWYDPNTDVKSMGIQSEKNFSAADILYTTIGGGYNYYINPNVKLMVWYDHVTNETTSLSGYDSDLPDDVLTFRVQFRF